MSRFASLLQRHQQAPKHDKKDELLTEMKQEINYGSLNHLSLPEVAALFQDIIRDPEVTQVADRITFGELMGYSRPKADEEGGGQRRATKEEAHQAAQCLWKALEALKSDYHTIGDIRAKAIEIAKASGYSEPNEGTLNGQFNKMKLTVDEKGTKQILDKQIADGPRGKGYKLRK